MNELEEKKERLEKAIQFLITIGEIEGDTPTTHITKKMGRHYSGVCSAINGSKRYLTKKFIQDFCIKYDNIISFPWLLDGKGEMTRHEKYNNSAINDTTITETLKDRIFKLKDWLIVNDITCQKDEERVFKMMGIKDKNRLKNIRNTYINKIQRAWPYVNIEWIRTGKGDMIINPANRNDISIKGMPYYNVDFLINFDDLINKDTVPSYYVDFQPFNNPGNIWCNFTGDSMSPRINNGDKICIRQVKIEDIIFGELYAIATYGNMRTIKWVAPSLEKDMFKLIPENKDPRYGEYQEIRKNEIKFIYKVIGTIKTF